MNPNKYLLAALSEAKKALNKNEVPVGAVVVKDNKIISRAHNLVVSRNDPTAHAEKLAIQKASKKLGTSRLDGCDIYVTLEPCAMCSATISLAKMQSIYYCLSDKKFGCVESNSTLYTNSSYFKPIIYSDINPGESKKLLQDFFKCKR